MTKKTMKKKRRKKIRRIIRLLGFLLLLTVVGLVLWLALRPLDETTNTAVTGDALWDGSWYADDLGRIEDDKALIKGMTAFEKKTGAKPFLTVLADVDPDELDMFAQDQYEALFAEGDHVLVVYDEWEEGTYYLAAKAGEKSAISREDVARLLDAIERAYADPANGTYSEAFGAGFAAAAKDASVTDRASSGVVMLLILGFLLILLSGVLILFLRRRVRDARRWSDDEYGD